MKGLIVFALCLAAWGAPRPKFFVVSNSNNTGQAAAVANQMEIFVAEALTAKLPCSSSMRPSDAASLLNWERQRQLLGAEPSPDLLANLAGSIGADHVVSIQVMQSGSRVSIFAKLIDARARVLANSTLAVPLDGNTVDKMEAFAKQFAGSVAGAGPKCPGQWRGTVRIESKQSIKGQHAQDRNKTFTIENTFTLDCKVAGATGTCSLASSGKLTGEDSSTESSAGGSVSPHVTVSVVGGKVIVGVGVVSVRGKFSASVAGFTSSEQRDMRFGPWRGEAPAAAGDMQSGTWSDAKGITTITWSLSRS